MVRNDNIVLLTLRSNQWLKGSLANKDLCIFEGCRSKVRLASAVPVVARNYPGLVEVPVEKGWPARTYVREP